MLRAIHLHGRLGKRFGRRFDLAVSSPTEAIRALIFMVPGFSEYIRHRGYVVSIGEGTVLDREALDLQLGRQTDIHITPAGAVSGIETILLGATLLITAAASIAVLSMPKVPTAASREESTKTASYIFDGAENVTEQGHPVPLVYGRFRVGSIVGSAGITTSDANEASVSADPSNPYLGGGSGYSGYVGSTPGIRGSVYGDEWVQLQKGGGKGGGSGSTRAAQEDPNSLQSQATAKVLDIVAEGEVVGLVDGMKSIYFDDTPLQNPDGSFNFAGVAIEQRVGLPDQDFIPGFGQNENSVEINTQVRVALGPVTRSVQNPNATVARVTIRLPQLYQQDTTNGDLKASSVAIKISVQADGGGFTDVLTKTFTGKTNSGYQWSTDVRLPNGAQRDIRVTRITPDSEVASLSNETHWDLLTEVVEAKLSYPDTAVFGLTVDARQFGASVPARSYDIKGLIVEVPSNYDPVTRAYTGVWDGTWKRAWTDNPAWVFRDIIVNRRYGLGARVPVENVDKWGLYAIAQHCDGMIPDGFGGMRPRYTINVCIKNPAAAYDVLASIASNFRGFAYWGSGAVVAVQDRPEDPSILITPANVIDGKISYSRVTPVEKRRSVAVVYWNDPDDGYRLTPEIVEDPDLIKRFGRRGDSGDDAVTAFGVTNRGQAHTMCRWLLEDEAPGSNAAATYEVGDDHGFVEPGRVAEVADPMFTQSRRGGRVRAATPAGLTIDAPYAFAAGQNYRLRVTLPDGTVSVRPITNGAGTTAAVALGGENWATPPNPGAVWTIETDQVANRQFRVRSISTDEPPFAVRAVLHDPTKWDRVELDRDISTPNFIELPTGPLKAPDNIDVFEFLMRDGDAAIPCAQVSWRGNDSRITFYQAQSKAPGQNWEPFADSIDVSRIVRGVAPGQWGFRVRGLDSLGRKTEWVQATFDLDAQVDSLPNVTGLMAIPDNDTLQTMLVWVKPDDRRPLRARVLFHESGEFDAAIELAVVDTQEWVVSKVGTYWVQTQFLQVVSANPPAVAIGDADLPAVDWEKIDGRPVSLEELDPDAQHAINDLVESYGDTASAAASAAAANASKVAAETAERAAKDAEAASAAAAAVSTTAATNADTARQQSEAARNDAQQAVTNATTQAGLADSARAAAASAASASESAAALADASAGAAAVSAGDASGYATTASGQATIATQRASEASQSASTATASKDAAATSASDASVSAGKAATSETNALGSASAAATSQSVAARAAQDAAGVAANAGASPGAALTQWGQGQWSVFDATYSMAGYPVVNGRVRLVGSQHVYPFAKRAILANRRYQMRARLRCVVDGGDQHLDGNNFYLATWDADGANYYQPTLATLGAILPSSGDVDWTSPVMGLPGSGAPFVLPEHVAWGRPFYRSPGRDTVMELVALELADVDAETRAGEAATASAASASAAAASQTAAGQSASAALTSETNAATSAGNAGTYASQASTSASNAAGSASAAEQKAGVAATAADTASGHAGNAAGSASAAAGSASAASASQSAAEQSASAASGSAATANTKAGEASASAGQAATSASGAASSASSAASSSAVSAKASLLADTAATNALYLDPAVVWDFSRGAQNGFAFPDYAVNGEADGVRLGSVGADPMLVSPPVSFLGQHYQRVIAELTWVDAGGGWQGTLYYGTDYHGWGETWNARAIGDPVPVAGGRTQLTFDMTAIAAASDWRDAHITSLRFDLHATAGGNIKVHSIRVVGSNALAPAQAAAAAAGSASSAAASQSAAGQAASAAQTSETNASTSAGQAGTSASQAATSATNAAGSASTASTQAGLSATAASNAQQSASAASGSASAASASASAAGESASVASGERQAAQTARGGAETAASGAATSASNAAGSASSAATSQSVAARAAQDAAGSALNDGGSPGQAPTQWSYNQHGVFQPDPAINVAGFSIVNGRLRIPGGMHIHPLSNRAIMPARRYRIMATIRAFVNDGNQQNVGGNTFYLASWSADGGYYQYYFGDLGPVGGDFGDVNFTSQTIGLPGAGAEVTINGAVAWGRPFYRSPGGANIMELATLRLVDVEGETKAAEQASASAASASSAAASQSGAAQSASAAQTSATNANTSAGQAGTSASNASTSATNAAGSASAAASSQAVAARAAQSALGAAANPTSPGAGPEAWSYDQWQLLNPTNTLAGMLTPEGLSVVNGVLRNSGNGGIHLHSKVATRIVPGRRYRADMRIRMLANGGFTTGNIGFLDAWNGDGLNVNGTESIYDFGSPTVASGELVGGSIVGTAGTPGINNALPVSTRWARLMFRTGVTGGAVQEIIEIGLVDIEAEQAAAGAASAAASSASAASASQSAAGQSASAAQTSATNASGYASNAQSSASSAASSASAASGSAAAAQQSAVITAQVNSNLANKGGTFSEWPDGAPWPSYWSNWGNGSGVRVVGLVGRWGFQQSCGAGASDIGLLSSLAQDVGFLGYRAGTYVVEFDLVLDAGSLQGTGVLFRALDANGAILADIGNHCATMPSQGSDGAPTGAGVPGQRYRFANLATLPPGTTQIMIYLMTAWTGFGAVAAKTVSWQKAGFRPASQPEIESGKVAGLSASVTTLSSAVAGIDGRTQAYFVVSANAGGTSASIEARAVGNPDGSTSSRVGVVAEEFSVTSTTAGVRRRVLSVIGSEVLINGNLASTAGVFLGSGAKWAYQLRTKNFAVSDGAVVDFGVDLGAVPTVDFSTIGLAPLAAGETYRLYADSLTPTGFVARLRIGTPGTSTAYNLNASSVPGSGPTRQIARGGNPESTNGVYTVRASGQFGGYAYDILQ